MNLTYFAHSLNNRLKKKQIKSVLEYRRRSASNQTMPGTAISPDPAGWVGDDSFYGTHIQAMIDAGCPE